MPFLSLSLEKPWTLPLSPELWSREQVGTAEQKRWTAQSYCDPSWQSNNSQACEKVRPSWTKQPLVNLPADHRCMSEPNQSQPNLNLVSELCSWPIDFWAIITACYFKSLCYGMISYIATCAFNHLREKAYAWQDGVTLPFRHLHTHLFYRYCLNSYRNQVSFQVLGTQCPCSLRVCTPMGEDKL